MIINESLGDIIARTINDVHPPFYYLVLSVWQDIFGSSVVSLRGFSVACGVATVILLYLLLRRLLPEQVAKIGALLAAFGPFLVRYSDEVRMYSLAALLAVLSTYLIVAALDKKTKRKWAWWLGYGLTMAAGLYTQYFFIFILPVHLVYTLYVHQWSIKNLLKNKFWWFGNLVAGGLFLIWLPTMLAQMSRVQEGFWIPPMSIDSISNTLSHFVLYNNSLTPIVGITLPIIAVVISLTLLKKRFRPAIWLLAGWLALPIIAVSLLSLDRPVYIDRYFTYSAPAFYALLAAMIYALSQKKTWLAPVLTASTLVLFSFGINNVGAVAWHRMGQTAEFVNQQYQDGDTIVSAELYTYFDFSYYNQTGSQIKLLSENPLGKYGEYSLLYDRPNIRVADFADIESDRVWVVGKTGEKEYFTTGVPDNWTLVSRFSAGDSAVQLYLVEN